MPAVENITIPAGDDTTLNFDISPDDGVSLAGATIYWWAARSRFTRADQATLRKSSLAGQGITITDEGDLTFAVQISRADTKDLLGAFYHEAKVVDSGGNHVTVTTGTMTVERTLIRPEDLP